MCNVKTILIAGNFSFFQWNAAGKRVLGHGYIFRDLGYQVVFIGCDQNRKEKNIVDTRKEYDGFLYYSFNGSRRTKEILDIKGAFNNFKSVVADIGDKTLSFIILYGSPVLAKWISSVIKYGKQRNIPVIFDCVDWIEKSGFNSIIKNTIKYIDTNYMKRYLAYKCDGVIAVSKYLFNYYEKKGCKTVIIPPVGKFEYIVDKEITNCVNEISELDTRINFIYAGTFSFNKNIKRNELKDRLDISIELMEILYKKKIDFVFDIFGVEKEEYLEIIPEHASLINELIPDKIFFHGKVANDKVCESLVKSDFLILNRDKSKVTMAGFPSKVSESLCCGTPVLTNDTSDLRDYISDYNNGLIMDFDKRKAAKQLINLCGNKKIIADMKKKCNKECVLDYHKFLKSMEIFLNIIKR